MAGGLCPDGHVDTLEASDEYADLAEGWFRTIGLADRITVHRGPAADTLPRLVDGAYDLAYIDADKAGYPAYLEQALRLVRRGGLIVADNAFQGGRIAAPADDDERAAGMRRYTETAMSHPGLVSALLTVGDGVVVSAVR
jgi:predicted O-methyltransferase YrrM